MTTQPLLRRPTALGACALAMMTLAGCHSGSNSGGGGAAGTTGAATGGAQTQLAFVTNNASDYWKICRGGTEAASKELGNVSVQYVMPSDSSPLTQRQDVDDLMTKGVKGLAISPVDPTGETDYLKGIAAKANLITSDSDAADSGRLCYIGTDNHAAGVMAGGLVKEALPQGGKIMVFVGKKDAQNAKDRISGLEDALKGSKVRVLDVRTDDTDRPRAKANAADAMVKYPDLAGMVGIWSYNGGQIASAVKEAGKVGKVKIIAFDQETDTMDAVKDGTIYGSIVQDPYAFGYQSIKLLDQLAHGDKSGIPPSKMILIPTAAIKKDQAAQYMADLDKKMGKS